MIPNLFRMNDWEMHRFLGTVLFLQFLFSLMIYLDILKFQIPILRQVLVFLFLTFIPGFILLRILRIHSLSNTESLLYSVGLSISFLMFIGFSINMIYPMLGIFKPFSLVSLMLTINTSLLLLCFLCYLSDKIFSKTESSNYNAISTDRKSFPKYILPLLFILFLAVSGTYLMNSYSNNILLLIFLIIVPTIAILVGFNIIPARVYPFLVFIVALSLLYHKSLISPYLWGWDIQGECYFANLVKSLSYWDYTIPNRLNSVLSTVIIAPMFSILGGMDLTGVFKIIYPFIFSLVPVGLYHIFRKEFDSKIAILSTLFFVFLSVYYNDMLQLGRQQIAEFFFVLLIMLLINRDLDIYKKYFLFSVFMASMIVSHYAIAYILVPILVIVLLLSNLNLFKREERRKNIRVIQYIIPIIFLAFTSIWYLLFSSGSGGATTGLMYAIENIMKNFGLFASPKASEAIALIVREYSTLHSLNEILHLTMIFFISIAILRLVFKFIRSLSKKGKINLGEPLDLDEGFAIFSILIFLALIANAMLPFASEAFDIYRMYHLSLFGLAPFAVTGFIFCIIRGNEIFRKLTGSKIKTVVLKENSLKIFSILLAVFLLFNSGLLYEILNDNPTSIALNEDVRYPMFTKEEVKGANWINEHRNNEYVWSSETTNPLFTQFYAGGDVKRTFYGATKEIPKSSYIFLGKHDSKISEKWVLLCDKKQYVALQESGCYKNIIVKRNKVYCNDNSNIYR